MPASPPCPGPGRVALWIARTDDVWSDASRILRAIAWLTPSERSRYGRFRHDADREMFLLGRVMARRLVGAALGIDPTAWDWQEGEHGRPEVPATHAPVSFNLAHSAGVVVCGIAEDRHVGVDVEFRRRPPVDPQVVRRFCSPDEVRDIEQRGPDDWRDQFLRYWTLKEAYLKARGLGIGVPLADVSFSFGADGVRVAFLNGLADFDTRWAFTLAGIGDTHFVAAAAPEADFGTPIFQQFTFGVDLLP